MITASNIHFTSDRIITVQQFIEILERSTLASRRPVDDVERIAKMLKHANLIVTAWDKELLVGVSRALTDFSYCTYLSDIAVDKSYQRQGIGKNLINETHRIAGHQTSLILLSAPDAMDYYPYIGMKKIDNGYIIKRSN
ncbi:MAG: GNAT family N-acetyltransferase [Rickettsiales bacterium]